MPPARGDATKKKKKKKAEPTMPVIRKRPQEELEAEWKLCLFPPDFRYRVLDAPYSAKYRNDDISGIYEFWSTYDRAVELDALEKAEIRRKAAEKAMLEELKKKQKRNPGARR